MSADVVESTTSTLMVALSLHHAPAVHQVDGWRCPLPHVLYDNSSTWRV